MKKYLAVILSIAMLLCLAVPAMASGETSASGEASGSSTMAPPVQDFSVDVVAQTAGISVLSGVVSVDEDAVEGTVDGMEISGVSVNYDGIGDWDGSTQFGRSGIVLSGEGDTIVLGGEEDVYEVNGEGYNSVIVLDNADQDEENTLAGGTRDSSDASEGNEGTGIYADAETVQVDNIYIYTAGYGRSALRLTSGVQTSVIKNSTIEAVGSDGTGSSAPGFIMMYASSRPALIESSGSTYFYNDDMLSSDWGVYSLDGCYGAQVYIVDCYSENTVGGYGAYALGANSGEENWAYFYGSYTASAQYGTIECAAGRTITGALSDAPEEALAELGDTELRTPVLANGWSYIGGNTNAITMQADISGAEIVGIVDCTHTVLDTANVTDRNHKAMDDTMDLYDYMDDMSVGASYFFLNYIHGAAIAIRSENVDMTLDDCLVYSSNGVAIQSVIGYDGNANGIVVADGTEYHGHDITIANMDLAGDILHEDYQRKMVLSLENATLEGAVVSGTWAGWEQSITDTIADNWTDECDELGLDADTIQETLAYDDSYETVWGVRMSIGADSVWTVTGDSSLYSLEVAEGGQVIVPDGASIYVDCDMSNADLTYDYTTGTQVDALTAGSYTGVVIVFG